MLESILGPIARDGLEKRDRVYVENFVVIPLGPGEERVASWMARDVPEGVSGQRRGRRQPDSDIHAPALRAARPAEVRVEDRS